MGATDPSRRQFLAAGAGTAGALAVASCAAPPGLDAVDALWDCGVASGLHSPTEAVLWTRFAPAALSPVEVVWEVATDPGFATVVDSGAFTAGPEADGCVKVLAGGLGPATSHWYRFSVGGDTSPTGHTRTLPAEGSSPRRARFAVASCQNFAAGWYPAWRSVAGLDLDGVIHLGDYIYESEGEVNPLLGDVRDDPSAAAEDLGTYRAKYRMYRSDPDLRAAHAAHGWAPVWDDHELVDNYDASTLLAQPARAAAAYRAWFEYQPVWPIDGTRIHRALRFGDLVDLALLDTRQHRDRNPAGDILVNTSVLPGSVVHAPGRTLMGTAQRDWLLDRLGAAQGDGVTWKVIGQQVMVAPLRMVDLDQPFLTGPDHAGIYLNVDQWDGYSAERDLLTAHLLDEGIANTAILTGDIHSFWQAAIHSDMEDLSSPAVAQEFVCGSISSTALGFSPDLADAFSSFTKGFSPAFRWVDWKRRGYGLLDCTPSAMRVEFHTVDPVRRTSPDRLGVAFTWGAGTPDVSLAV
jgi:phosphodiesterase/alkaline phosphatase D-like protein